MTEQKTDDRIGIYGYGSLLTDAGADIAPRIVQRLSFLSPWPIEYARSSRAWGDGPTLVIHHGGKPLRGEILVLDVTSDHLREVRGWLREREHNPPARCIKQMRMGALETVLYCALEDNIEKESLTPRLLASLAIASVREKPEKNGIRYLRQNIERNLITPLTHAYRDEILRHCGAKDLLVAETILLRSA